MTKEISREQVLDMNHDFSARFSNRVLNLLIENVESDKNMSVSPSRLQAVLVLLANWTSPRIRRKILDVVGSEVMDIREANILCSKSICDIKVLDYFDDGENYIPQIELKTFLWVMKNLDVNPFAIEKVLPDFDVVQKSVDFTSSETKNVIDIAIKGATHGLINELNTEISPETQALITDILYFKAGWEREFYEEDTSDRPFYGTKGKRDVPMMKRTGDIDYAETGICQTVRINYTCESSDKKAFSMRIYLPKKGHTIPEVLHELWESNFEPDFEEQYVQLLLPKFSTESDINMKDVLQKLDLECIFESKSIISECIRNIQISDIKQQVKVIVDEKGTEAAALTSICLALGCPPDFIPKPIKVTVNRPFIFEIAEDSTNTILFTGIINNIEG